MLESCAACHKLWFIASESCCTPPIELWGEAVHRLGHNLVHHETERSEKYSKVNVTSLTKTVVVHGSVPCVPCAKCAKQHFVGSGTFPGQ